MFTFVLEFQEGVRFISNISLVDSVPRKINIPQDMNEKVEKQIKIKMTQRNIQ